MIGRLASLIQKAGNTVVTFELFGEHARELEALREQTLDVDAKVHREKRSRDANALMWAICDEIASAINTPITKEDVYRRAVKDVGKFEVLTFESNEAVERFRQIWRERGIGWVTLKLDSINGKAQLAAYYGSSVYDTKEMSRLIDYLIDEAEQMQIPLRIGRDELDEALKAWSDRK